MAVLTATSLTGITTRMADSAMSAGSIVQMTVGSTNNRVETSSSSYVATNLSASITPSTNQNWIYIQVSGDSNTNEDDNGANLTIYRSINGGTFTNLGHGTWGFTDARSNAARLHSNVCINFLDSPTTTSSIEYKVYIRRSNSGSGNVEFPVSNASNYNYMHLQEVAV